MQFIRNDEFLAASQITGSKHNLLQVRLASGPQQKPFCEKLPAIGQCTHESLDEELLVAKVLDGLSEANKRFGASYSVTHIRYVENDTKPEVVYGYMCLMLIEHLQTGGVFVETNIGQSSIRNAL
ncbi:hypothetical protein [Chitinimonas sp. BJB300]|uniref:hypothetical protein n=1 Tax=Chitinimonas sp. BJB300 TaxID=1559339 RepID=UPI000C106618|nr:hypothetical protein [Chitinimonas sp. BJB300]PHV09950.1 hypothetical protein CSQ89_18845 [Chitinimonas sp. BJB300]TSJ82865.1 hypothetical protein FG002_021945 [Chitinimonas sp. BJB300]